MTTSMSSYTTERLDSRSLSSLVGWVGGREHLVAPSDTASPNSASQFEPVTLPTMMPVTIPPIIRKIAIRFLLATPDPALSSLTAQR